MSEQLRNRNAQTPRLKKHHLSRPQLARLAIINFERRPAG